MALARAFTLRAKRNGDSPPTSPLPTVTPTFMKRMGSVIDRSKISAPVELISTTNMLSYDAPDVATMRPKHQLQDRMPSSTTSASSSSSSSSGDDSDASEPARHSNDLTDASSVDASPTTSPAPKPNHLSEYFQAAQDKEAARHNPRKVRKSVSSIDLRPAARAEGTTTTSTTTTTLPPAIPQRALSHSKSAHLQLARKRSLQSLDSAKNNRTASPSPSRPPLGRSSSVREQRPSIDFFAAGFGGNSSSSSDDSASVAAVSTPGSSHPFGRELEKLSEEVAEELGDAVRDAELRDDVEVMRACGLCKFGVDEYLAELRPLYIGALTTTGFGRGNHPADGVPVWI